MNRIPDQITELNENYHDLGDVLLLLESVILAMQMENEFSRKHILSSLHFLTSSIEQYTKDICFLTNHLSRNITIQKEAALPPPLFNPLYNSDQTASHPD